MEAYYGKLPGCEVLRCGTRVSLRNIRLLFDGESGRKQLRYAWRGDDLFR